MASQAGQQPKLFHALCIRFLSCRTECLSDCTLSGWLIACLGTFDAAAGAAEGDESDEDDEAADGVLRPDSPALSTRTHRRGARDALCAFVVRI